MRIATLMAFNNIMELSEDEFEIFVTTGIKFKLVEPIKQKTEIIIKPLISSDEKRKQILEFAENLKKGNLNDIPEEKLDEVLVELHSINSDKDDDDYETEIIEVPIDVITDVLLMAEEEIYSDSYVELTVNTKTDDTWYTTDQNEVFISPKNEVRYSTALQQQKVIEKLDLIEDGW